MIIDTMSKLLLTPPATGLRACFYAVGLIAIPTALRLLLSDQFLRMPFITYLPFIIAAAVILERKYAAGMAFLAWLVADMLFMEPRFDLSLAASEILGFLVFIASSILVIAVVEGARAIVENSLRPIKSAGFTAPVVFSLEAGQAWASWYGSHSWVRLGPEDEVAEMMEDFLAHRELGKRLARHQPSDFSENAETTAEKMAPRA